MRTFNSISNFATWAILAGISMLLFALGYVVFLERPYLSYEGPTFQVVGGPFHSGEVVPLRVTRCNRDKVTHSYYLAHSLLNVKTEVAEIMPEAYVTIPPGCHTAVSKIHVLPANISPGRYIVYGGAQVRGTIRTFDVTWESEVFEVVK